jgi:hypothetical protein
MLPEELSDELWAFAPRTEKLVDALRWRLAHLPIANPQ